MLGTQHHIVVFGLQIFLFRTGFVRRERRPPINPDDLRERPQATCAGDDEKTLRLQMQARPVPPLRIAPRLAFNRPLQDTLRTDQLGRHPFQLNCTHFTATASTATGKVIGINRWR